MSRLTRAIPEERALNHSLTVRPITSADEELLCQVYASTRQEELAPVPWTEAQKEAFLRWQFALQHKHYAENYEGAEFQVILQDGVPIGRLYLLRRPGEIRIVDIALLPAYRNQGIGSALLQDILAEGQRAGLPVTIHVESLNPARRLYERLGFRHVADSGVYHLMEWRPHAGQADKPGL